MCKEDTYTARYSDARDSCQNAVMARVTHYSVYVSIVVKNGHQSHDTGRSSF